MTKRDCFAFAKEEQVTCTVLKHMQCKMGHCEFYKSKKQFLKERKKYPFDTGYSCTSAREKR